MTETVIFFHRFHPKFDCPEIFGQAIQKHGEFSFGLDTLREMTFKFWALKNPEMTIIVSEYKIHSIGDALRRELVQVSKYRFHHDENEDFASKLHLTIESARGELIMSKLYSQFSSFNESYRDDESYLNEADYIYEDATTEELLKIEDLSMLFEGPDPFEASQNDEKDEGNDAEDLSMLFESPDPFEASQKDEKDEANDTQSSQDLLLPSTNCEERFPQSFESSPEDGGNLIPEEQEGQFKDLLTEPLLYDFQSKVD